MAVKHYRIQKVTVQLKWKKLQTKEILEVNPPHLLTCHNNCMSGILALSAIKGLCYVSLPARTLL